MAERPGYRVDAGKLGTAGAELGMIGVVTVILGMVGFSLVLKTFIANHVTSS